MNRSVIFFNSQGRGVFFFFFFLLACSEVSFPQTSRKGSVITLKKEKENTVGLNKDLKSNSIQWDFIDLELLM